MQQRLAEDNNIELRQHQRQADDWPYRSPADGLRVWANGFLVEFALQTTAPPTVSEPRSGNTDSAGLYWIQFMARSAGDDDGNPARQPASVPRECCERPIQTTVPSSLTRSGQSGGHSQPGEMVAESGPRLVAAARQSGTNSLGTRSVYTSLWADRVNCQPTVHPMHRDTRKKTHEKVCA